ncbi:hypothetical protein [Pseudokineococcus lusitanus]|uniref:Uncharacterized protein n=1 Tax=Pseudokineococcus lusitanus TaxID=763993 RepID=A0A3N1HK78_9ACTN|nr:hypothetical protein [Pseudokineococcus lusitanus]ROP42899.1 hypothetical protein EDC03_2188 [Pseudokineococcus lusitanus]
MSALPPPSLERLRAGVDAVLVPRGFAPGQVGSDDRSGQMIWCAAADELAARFPALPTSREPEEGWSTRCTDVVLDVAVVDGHWLLTGVDLEEHRLDRALAHVGLSGPAREAAALVGSPVGDSASSLPALLTRLLDASTPGR